MGSHLRSVFDAGEAAIGGWCVSGAPLNVEMMAREGYDYVGIDCQHGLIGYDGMVPLITSMARLPSSSIVRVPFNDTAWMGRALDAGADGVIVPMVNSREEAERAVAACRYAPEGVRSFGPVRAGMFLNTAPAAEVNRQVLCFAMIETIQAVERCEEICATPGLSGIYVGPIDLALTMGVNFGYEEVPAAHEDAVQTVRKACEANGIIPGIHTASGADARHYLDSGFRFVTVSTDSVMLRNAARAQLAEAKGQAATEGGGIYT